MIGANKQLDLDDAAAGEEILAGDVRMPPAGGALTAPAPTSMSRRSIDRAQLQRPCVGGATGAGMHAGRPVSGPSLKGDQRRTLKANRLETEEPGIIQVVRAPDGATRLDFHAVDCNPRKKR